MRKFTLKKRLGLLVVLPVATLATASAVYAAATFGPARPTYTWASPATSITFNSITDNPVFGDERQLLKARDVNSSTNSYATQTTVTDNEEVVLEVYFHNNAASNLNLVAHNTQVKISLPSNTATTLSPTGYISADNATPSQVWATADLTSSQPFSITYEPGTAKLYTNYVNGIVLSDNVVTTGTLVGSNGADGNVPGCSQFSGYVTIRVRVHVPTTPTPIPTPTPTPAKPAVLPNTGPGDVIGVFGGASAVAAAGHFVVSRRRK